MQAVALLDPARLERPDTTVLQEPFPLLIAHGQLPEDARDELERDFPRYGGAGFFPWDPKDCGPSINVLITGLTAPGFAHQVGERLGVEQLDGYPTLVTLCRSLNLRHGTIHTDSRSKVVTALLYLNPVWPASSAGCLRFLRAIDDIGATVVPELMPLYGEFAAFRRTENSFHGHLPFEGERRVIQVAWLVDEKARERKTRRGRLSRLLKHLLGDLDRRYGAGRKANASHPD